MSRIVSSQKLLRFSFLLILLEFIENGNGQLGTCYFVGGVDVGAANADGTCSQPGATAYFNRCCLEETPSTTPPPTTKASSCEQMGMMDVGPSIGDACDGDAVSYSGRCCIPTMATSSTTSTSKSTSTPTTTTTPTTPTTPTTTKTTSTPSTPTTTKPTTTTTKSTTTTTTTLATTTTTAVSTSTPPSLYKNGVYVMKCIDVDPTTTCLPKILSCLSNKMRMAFICCGSCYAVFPNFLPKMKNCVDDFPQSCAYWGKDRCSKTTPFGQKMMDHCKKTCDNCPKN